MLRFTVAQSHSQSLPSGRHKCNSLILRGQINNSPLPQTRNNELSPRHPSHKPQTLTSPSVCVAYNWPLFIDLWPKLCGFFFSTLRFHCNSSSTAGVQKPRYSARNTARILVRLTAVGRCMFSSVSSNVCQNCGKGVAMTWRTGTPACVQDRACHSWLLSRDKYAPCAGARPIHPLQIPASSCT